MVGAARGISQPGKFPVPPSIQFIASAKRRQSASLTGILARGSARAAIGVCLALASTAMHAAEDADEYPRQSVRWVVPYAPGGSIDVVGRMIAARLSNRWLRQVYVDNRLGIGGRAGVRSVIAAAPDGYTQLLAPSTNYTIGRGVFKNLGYDPQNALAPVTIVASSAQVLISDLSFRVKNVRELVALAQARPGAVNYGSTGAGGSLHLAAELFKSMTGITMTHVAYEGGILAADELISGQIQVLFLDAPAGAQLIKSGKVRALGVSTAQRSPLLPDVPAIAEAGVPGFNIDVWYGLSAPAGTSTAIINKTWRDVSRVLNEPEIRKQLSAYGVDPVSITPEEMAGRIRTETAHWAKVIAGSSIRFD